MKRILIANDQPEIRDLLQSILHPCGYQTLIASNGREALKLALWKRPDLILLDISRPGSYLDSIVACRCIKSIPTTAHIPVVMISQLDEQSMAQRSKLAGASDFIEKPFEPLALVNKVKRVCE